VMAHEGCSEVLRNPCALTLSDEPLASGVEHGPKSGPKSGPVESYATVFAWFIGNFGEILVPRRGLEPPRPYGH
jgi:hypothetical protein